MPHGADKVYPHGQIPTRYVLATSQPQACLPVHLRHLVPGAKVPEGVIGYPLRCTCCSMVG